MGCRVKSSWSQRSRLTKSNVLSYGRPICRRLKGCLCGACGHFKKLVGRNLGALVSMIAGKGWEESGVGRVGQFRS